MSPFRYRDDDSSTANVVLGAVVGALAGFAAGMFVAQKVGGFSGLTSRLRRPGMRGPATRPAYGAAHGAMDEEDEFEDIEEDELEPEQYDESLEERVLEAFKNDPILCERAIDIGSISDGVIELAGWVDNDDEAQHAVTVARGVPGVDTVVNRVAIGDEEERFDEAARRFESGDPALSTTRWEGQRVGTGRRRQGSSADPDRHADPKVELGERWSSADDAMRNAADDMEGMAERRRASKRAQKGDRTGGSPVAPSGVPKGDHVANTPQADRQASRADVVRDTGGAQTESTDRL
ncbi:MAG TPA: BON domain-containing protein [Gemmatimonadaceae bacterium]